MKLETLQYKKDDGWSVKTFPEFDSNNTLILIFAAPEFINNIEPIKELYKHYPKSKMIGCSTAGEISGQHIYDESMSAAIIQFDKTEIQIVKAPLDNIEKSSEAGINIFKQLDKDNLSGIFILSNGVNVNGSELVRGLNLDNKKNVCITGGLAGDGSNFKETWSIYNGEISTTDVVAVGFYGAHIQIGHASQGGWDVFGPERRVTKSKNNILYEIDNQPALKLYKTYLGERASELPASGLLYPLSIRKDKNDSVNLVRTILDINEKEQSLTFAGDIPEGYLAQLMRANFERLISSAGEAGDIIIKKVTPNEYNAGQQLLSIPISCVGRRLLLGERTEEETETLLNVLPKITKQIGFYSYGEISPYTTGVSDLHNQTMTITTLSESEEARKAS